MALNILKSIGGLFSGGLLKGAGDLIDKFVTSPEEKEQLRQSLIKLTNEHQEKLQEIAVDNTHSARELQKAALGQEDRFSKRFVYYLAGVWSLAGISYIFLITFTNVVNDRHADTVLGFLMGTIVSTIINYFFGSAMSKPSLKKEKKGQLGL